MRHIAQIERDGYCVIENFLSAQQLTEVRRVFALYLDSHAGRNNFEGLRTERVYTLVARARVMWDIVQDARIMALCEHFLLPNFLLTASQAIRINPGEAPQPFHSDDAFYHLPHPRPMVSLSTIVAVDAFTPQNGATNLIPVSHRWSDAERADMYSFTDGQGGDDVKDRLAQQAICAEMPAGACLVFSGTLVHRGGQNQSAAPRDAFSNQYCQPWARQQENFILGVPQDVARQMPTRLQELLGYSIHPPFIGQLSASHPVKALAPDYVNRVTAQAAAVGAGLPE
jgi:ectoine hydroxylase-related dioxygenase (phytanoyl-CoA dioxygenase family)